MSTATTIPSGSLVLVTGANGYIGSHIVDDLLASGYKVRGTARSASSIAPLKEMWDKKYGPGKFEAAVVENMHVDGAFDQAMKGVSGVAHVASVVSFSPNVEEVVEPTVKGTLSLLRSAAAQPSVKRFVLTSSSIAGDYTIPNKVYDLDENSWNEVSVEKAYNLPDSDPEKSVQVYGASKILGEKAAWKFVEDEKPGFVLNTVLPNFNFGPILHESQRGSSAGSVREAYNGDTGFISSIPPQWFVDVRDTARLHTLALTSSALGSPGARIWAVAEPFNINDLLQTFRKLRPGKQFLEDIPNADRNLARIDNKRGTELLGGWRKFEDSVRDTIEGM